MGGGRVAPNPSNEVDIYDPGTNTWTTGDPVLRSTARRNFPTDTDGTTRIWLAGGYDMHRRPRGLDGDLLCSGGNSDAHAVTDRNAHGGTFSDTNRNTFGDTISDANGDPNRRPPRPE